MNKKKYSEVNCKITYVADYGMRTLFEEGFVKLPASHIIEITKLIKSLRELDMEYSMRVVKYAKSSSAYEFYFPERIDFDK